MSNEVFTETVERYAASDVSLLVGFGGPVFEPGEEWHTLNRLRYHAGAMMIESQLLATFHARISCVTVNSDSGERVFTVIGLNRSGAPFSFDISERAYWHGRRFSRALHQHAGAGTFVVPGRLAATRRAVWDLSRADE
jgi:hypothetical protein